MIFYFMFHGTYLPCHVDVDWESRLCWLGLGHIGLEGEYIFLGVTIRLRDAVKKKIAYFQTFAQIWVGGSGKNLIQKINLIRTKY